MLTNSIPTMRMRSNVCEMVLGASASMITNNMSIVIGVATGRPHHKYVATVFDYRWPFSNFNELLHMRLDKTPTPTMKL